MIGFPKGQTRKQRKGQKDRAEAKVTKAVRAQVFKREHDVCRCCGWRTATSMHELRPRSLGGKRTLENSIAVCGSGTTGCHGFLQRHEIMHTGTDARNVLGFLPHSHPAKAWLAFDNHKTFL